MPYLKSQKPYKPYEKMNRLLKGYDMNGLRLSKIIKCSQPTAKRKLDNPELLTLGDLYAIHDNLHISIDELRNAISR